MELLSLFREDFLLEDREACVLKDGAMPNQARVAKVLATLLASMTIGAILLMVLGHNPPSAGPFSLWTYCLLDPVKEAIKLPAAQSSGSWDRIEVYYSGTKTGNIEQLASLNRLAGPEDIDCHFCVCNGHGGHDGQILPTEKWQRQRSAISGSARYGGGQTVRICIIADGKTTYPTNCQIKRIQVLTEGLCEKFRIRPASIRYPRNWR